tara:strand:- start:660 stop:971 length:312 start_codon:yes stop_codon:yes gene_type:complete
MSTDNTTDVQLDEKIVKKALLPSKYKVVMINDDSTPMEWVVQLLTDIFKHSVASAEKIMLTIHGEGAAVVGIYSFEIAEQKSVEAMTLSRNNGFPLQLKLEED